jgi:hypothetical protein
MSPTDKCRYCGTTDTILHRIIECGAEQQMWKWTCGKIATILRTTGIHLPPEWLIRPQSTLWPSTWRRAILLFLAQLVTFRHDQYSAHIHSTGIYNIYKTPKRTALQTTETTHVDYVYSKLLINCGRIKENYGPQESWCGTYNTPQCNNLCHGKLYTCHRTRTSIRQQRTYYYSTHNIYYGFRFC